MAWEDTTNHTTITSRLVLTPQVSYVIATLDMFGCEAEKLGYIPYCYLFSRELKGLCSPKRLCALVLLFWPGSFIECSVLIGCISQVAIFN